MKFKSNTERTLALNSAQEIVGSAMKAGRDLPAGRFTVLSASAGPNRTSRTATADK